VTKGTWVKLVATSFGSAALVGAAQLGVGQALSIIDVGHDVTSSSDDAHHRTTTWLVLVFAAAVLAGVAVGRRSIRRRVSIVTRQVPTVLKARDIMRLAMDAARGPVALTATRLSAVTASALGAAAAFSLVWVPARAANGQATGSPEIALAVTSAIGIGVGMVLAFASLVASPIGAGLATTVGWVWMVGLTSIVLQLGDNQPAHSPRLAVLDAPTLVTPKEWWLGPYLMMAVAGVVALLIAVTARWLGASRPTIALSGFGGPALVAIAYIVAGPGLGGDDLGQAAPYLAAILSSGAGLLVSGAIAATAAESESYPAPVAQPGVLTGTIAHPAAAIAAAPTITPPAIAATPAGPAIYQPSPRRPPLDISKVMKVEPPYRVDSASYIDADPADARARAKARAQAEAAAKAEAARQADTRKAEAARKAQAEAARKAEAEAARKAETDRKAQAEAARRAEAEAARKAETDRKAQAEAARRAEAEAARRAETERKAQAEAERKAEQGRAASKRANADRLEAVRVEQARVEAEQAKARVETERNAAAVRRADAERQAKADRDDLARQAEEARQAYAARQAQLAAQTPPATGRRARALAKEAKREAAKAEAARRVQVRKEALAAAKAAKTRRGKESVASVKDPRPPQDERTESRTKNALRPREKEHVDWVTNLVNTPHDPELKTRRRG
jgi:hypothetical protein